MGFTSGQDFFYNRAKEMGVEIPEGASIGFDVFAKVGLPPVVACTCCGMTMTLLSDSCLIDNDTLEVVCKGCSGEE